MLVSCRVAREIWFFCFGEIPEFPQPDVALFQFFQHLSFVKPKIQPQNNLPFFKGWRIWKMCNKLIFENKKGAFHPGCSCSDNG
ncbi:hypothetical protein Bca4012_076350 [Brassica carinata]